MQKCNSFSRLDRMSERQPQTKNVRFPLFNYSTGELLEVCEVLQATLTDCLSESLISDCIDDVVCTTDKNNKKKFPI